MREKTMWIVIVLLALALLLVIFTQAEQGRHMRRLSRMEPASRMMEGVFSRMPRATSTTLPNEKEVPPEKIPPFVSENGRVALGSVLSPDGQWMMQLIETGAPDNMIEHRIILKGVKGQPNRVLVTQSETAKTAKSEEPGTHRWHLAGWSKDGKKLYVATEMVYGYGTDGPRGATYGEELWEISVESGTMKKIYTAPKADAIYGNGFVDVSAIQNQLLTMTNGKVYLSDVKGGSRREVKVILPTKQDEWRRFVLNTAGTHLVALYERFPVNAELGAMPLETRMGLFNLKTNKYQDLGSVNGGDVAWKDEKTLTIVGQNGQAEQREVQLP